MVSAAHGTITLRASPRLYRGKVLLLALAIAVVSLAEALRTETREGAAASAGPEGSERVVPDRADVVVAPDTGAPVAPEVAFDEAAGPFAEPLAAASCAACGCNARLLRLAPRVS